MWRGGAAIRDVAYKCLAQFYVDTEILLYPTNYCFTAKASDVDDDDITVPTTNITNKRPTITAYHARLSTQDMQAEIAGGTFRLPTKHAIADSGATQIFVMDGTPVINKRPTTIPLRVALVDGCQVMSTHMCDIKIEGLPVI